MKMKLRLSKNNQYVHYRKEPEICNELRNKLPSQDCLSKPSLLVILKDQIYHIVKSRYSSSEDVSELDFSAMFTLDELKRICNPSTKYDLPKEFDCGNILIVCQ